MHCHIIDHSSITPEAQSRCTKTNMSRVSTCHINRQLSKASLTISFAKVQGRSFRSQSQTLRRTIMDGLLLLAFTSLLLISIVYVCVRRGRHGGLAGGDSTVLTPPGVAEPGMGRILTLQDVAEHNMPTDLWLIINRKVYDFTEVRY
jgi:hypothetical protein